MSALRLGLRSSGHCALSAWQQDSKTSRPCSGHAASFSSVLAVALVVLRRLMSTLHCVCACETLAFVLSLHGSRTANPDLLCLQHALMSIPLKAYAMCIAGKGHWHDGPGHQDSWNVAADGASEVLLLDNWSADSSPLRH